MDADNGIAMEGYLFKRASNAFKTWNRYDRHGSLSILISTVEIQFHDKEGSSHGLSVDLGEQVLINKCRDIKGALHFNTSASTLKLYSVTVTGLCWM